MDNPSFRNWLVRAREDLLWTQANLREKVWYGACFTAQQTAEKALKAYLIGHDKKARRIHDLGALLEECIQLDKTFEELREYCVTLTDYYAPARYPDIAEFIDFTEGKASEAFVFAEKILQFVEERLKVEK